MLRSIQKRNLHAAFDRSHERKREINLAVNSMVQVSDDLAALAPGATSPAATFASELSSTVDPLIRSLEEVQGVFRRNRGT